MSLTHDSSIECSAPVQILTSQPFSKVKLSAFDTLNSLAKLIIDALKQVLVVDIQLANLAQQLVLDPVLINDDFHAVEVTNVGIDAGHLRALVKLHGQVDDLANVALSLSLSLLSRPRGTLHELLAFHRLGSQNILGASETSIELLVLLDQKTTLTFDLVIGKASLHLECGVVVSRTHALTRGRELASSALLNDALKLSDLDGILVLHPCELTQMCILEDSMGLSEEVIDQ